MTLEETANAMLAADRKKLLHCPTGDWLTWEQMVVRWRHEVYSDSGVLHDSFKMGMFRRAHNPLFGKRPKRDLHPDDHE